MGEPRLVDLNLVIAELRRYELSEILKAGHVGPSGFIARLYDRDPSTLIEPQDHATARGLRGLSDEELQRQLGICPACGLNVTVVNTEGDAYTCVTPVCAPQTLGLPPIRGCGATWRGARMGTPR